MSIPPPAQPRADVEHRFQGGAISLSIGADGRLRGMVIYGPIRRSEPEYIKGLGPLCAGYWVYGRQPQVRILCLNDWTVVGVHIVGDFNPRTVASLRRAP